MDITTSRDGGTTRLSISGDLTFETANDVGAALKAVPVTDNVELRFEHLGALDLSGLQLLYAARLQRDEAGHTLTLSGDEAVARIARMAEFAGLPVPAEE